MADRVQLNENEVEEVVGGHFNWWRESKTGLRKCMVNGIGTFVCTVEAKDTFAWLKAEHKDDDWSEQQYVDALIASGDFTAI